MNLVPAPARRPRVSRLTRRDAGRAIRVGALAALLGLLALTPFGAGIEERLGLAWLFQVRGALPPPADVAVVGLGPDSARALALPDKIRDWPRSIYARLIERLVEAHVSVIVIDLFFEEPRSPHEDAALAGALARADRVVLLEHVEHEIRPVTAERGALAGTGTLAWPESPFPALAEAAAGLGPFPLPSPPYRVDQFWAFGPAGLGAPTLPVVALQLQAAHIYPRWLELLRQAGLKGIEQLPATVPRMEDAAALRTLMLRLHDIFRTQPNAARRATQLLAARQVPDGERRLMAALLDLYRGPDTRYLNFYGPARHITTVPLHALIGDQAAPHEVPDLRGRVVFIGQSAMQFGGDYFRTVFSRANGINLSGVEIAATAFANLVEGRLVEPASPRLSLALLVGFGLGVGAIASVLPAIAAVGLMLLFAGAFYAGAQITFSHHALWLPLVTPLFFQLPLALVLGLVLQHREAQRVRDNLNRGLRYYLPEKLAGQLSEDARPVAGAELVYSTCLVSDAERFTAFAEKRPPQEVSAFLNGYFELLFGEVRRYGGLVTDVLGDGMTCVWTSAAPDPARRHEACCAALAIQEVLRERAQQRSPVLPTRIGLHSGWVAVGSVGGSGRLVYSVIGDIVNTASRIEALNKQLGTRLLATRAVVENLCDLVVRPLGLFRVCGRSEPLEVVEIVGRAQDGADVAHLERFADALAAFRAGRWAEAAARFEALLAERGEDGPAHFYLRLLKQYEGGDLPAEEPTVVKLASK